MVKISQGSHDIEVKHKIYGKRQKLNFLDSPVYCTKTKLFALTVNKRLFIHPCRIDRGLLFG